VVQCGSRNARSICGMNFNVVALAALTKEGSARPADAAAKKWRRLNLFYPDQVIS
jgi:hypothetical protein